MVLTEERAKLLASYLEQDKERAKRLFDTAPEEAVKEINAAGYDFSVEELIDFGDAMSLAVSKNGELSADDLENVAGGLGVVATFAIAYGIAIGCGYVVGRLNKW